MPDEYDVADGEIAIVCFCGVEFLWRIEEEDLPPGCPACRDADADTDGAAD